MPHDARGVANLILSDWNAHAHDITNKKINKLIYFAHGFSLARLRRPLVVNHVEAWEHGPVIRVAYDAFKRFGFRPITDPATYFDYKVGAEVVAQSKLDETEGRLLRRTMEKFMEFSGDQLEDLTHESGSPWSLVWRADRRFLNRIPDDLIAKYFAARFELGRYHS